MASVERFPDVGRFRIEEEIGRGGMGLVLRGRDAASGELVAIKRMLGGSAETARFRREATLLRRLSHPGIVQYVDHGEDEQGPWFAMEWVNGPSLDAVGAGRRLPIPQVLEIGAQLADALAAAHAAGILHRDVKPANVLLASEVPVRTKLADFGVARDTTASTILTQAGTVVGTPLYMAPEQLRAEVPTPSADVYSLGAVLFELAAGRPPFDSESAFAVIGRVLLEPAPRLDQVVPEAPSELVHVVAACLAKTPQERRSARAIADELRRLADIWAHAPTIATVTPPNAVIDYAREERTAAVLVARRCEASLVRELVGDLATACDVLPDGTTLALFTDARSPDAAVLRATRAAIAIAEASPSACILLATGRVDSRGTLGGQAFDRAAALLVTEPGIHVDLTTASLLDDRFDLARESDHATLRGEMAHEGMRLLLGKPTPTVGRHAELAQLVALVDAVRDEGEARVAIVTAPAGQGKSRLRRQLIEHLDARPVALQGLVVRFEPASEGTPWAALARALTAWRESTDDADKGRAVATRLALRFGLDAREEAHLAQVLGVVTPEDEPALAFGRRAPDVLHAGIREALGKLFRTASGDAALALVLEDTHWADNATLELVGELSAEPALPLAVFAFARPEVAERLPESWSRRAPLRLELGPLPSRAAERLVRAVLPAAQETVARRIVELAAGNPLVIEELIRAYDATGVVVPTASIENVFEARMARLPARERMVARVAAVVGEIFWIEAVESMLVGTSTDVRDAIASLEREEVVSRRAASRLRSSAEMIFRHALLRDAAEAGLPDDTRTALHGAAAAWRIHVGDDDLTAIARHAELGGQQTLAGECFARAGHAAWLALDGGTAKAHLRRAVDLLPREHTERFGVHVALEEIHRASGEPRARLRQLATLRRMARTGSLEQQALTAIREAKLAHDAGRLTELLSRAGASAELARGASNEELAAEALLLQVDALRELGQVNKAMDVLNEILEIAPAPVLRGRAFHLRGVLYRRQSRIAEAVASYDDARALYAAAGARAYEARTWNAAGYALMVDGQLGEAVVRIRHALTLFEQIAFVPARALIIANLANAFIVAGLWGRARELLDEALSLHRAFDKEGFADTLSLRARVAIEEGDLTLAESLLRESEAVTARSGSRYDAPHASVVRGWLCMARERPREAVDCFTSAARLARSTALRALHVLALAEGAQAKLATGDRGSATADAQEAALLLASGLACEWRIEATTAALAVLPDGDDARRQLLSVTAGWLGAMSARIADEELAAAFFARPAVAALR